MVFQNLRSTVCNDLLVAFEQPWSEVKVFERGLSRVCGDIFFAFEQAWAGVMVFERCLSRVCGYIFVAFEDVWSKVGAEALRRPFEPWSVRIKGGTVWSCSNSISKERADAW